MKQPTRELARNRWHAILPQLGVDPKYLVNRHGPCPICNGGKDRFRWDNKDGLGGYYCSQCGAGDGFKLAMEVSGQPFSDLAAKIDELVGSIKPVSSQSSVRDIEKIKRRLLEIGKNLQPVKFGDPVHRYLTRRAIAAVPFDHLRLHPAMPYYHEGKLLGAYPAMVAAFRQPSGAAETYHITYLTADGHKADLPAPKKVMTPLHGLAGCAIRLSDTADHIAICEGIETALSVTALYGLPCWSCYSANAMEQFQPPKGVKRITIYGDADESYTGQKAAMTAAFNLRRGGYEVDVADFLPLGTDYNDVLMEKQSGKRSAA
jgi:putative DNA primase/helicase